MDPSRTPWRVLEEPADQAPARTDEPATGGARLLAIPRTTLLTGGFAAALAIAALALAFGGGSSGTVAVEGGSPLGSQRPVASASADARGSTFAGRLLVVEIVGAVDRPGVFRMPADARVGDLVAAAGGYGPRVDANRAGRELNLAAPLHDGDQIRVPSRDDGSAPAPAASGGGSTGGGAGSTTRLIDLARATAAELDTLPGIGPATAAKIIASRAEQPFAAVEDLRTRKLVGEKTFEKLKDLVTVP